MVLGDDEEGSATGFGGGGLFQAHLDFAGAQVLDAAGYGDRGPCLAIVHAVLHRGGDTTALGIAVGSHIGGGRKHLYAGEAGGCGRTILRERERALGGAERFLSIVIVGYDIKSILGTSRELREADIVELLCIGRASSSSRGSAWAAPMHSSAAMMTSALYFMEFI